MENDKNVKNSLNRFELEGNVGYINDVYTNPKGKKSLRFDLCQNNGNNTQYVPIILKGKIVDSYSEEIAKGDWIKVKGRISTYLKEVNKDGKSYNEKAIEILGFEVEDRNKQLVYKSDGTIENKNKQEEKER